jgi:signal transduction histidine kinase
MISFRNLSIPNKIVAMIMIISGAALLLTSGSLIAYDISAARRDLITSANAFARIVADNANASVSFNDTVPALETLNSLRADPTIIAACIYTPEGLFVQRVIRGAAPCPARPAAGTDESNLILVSAPIELNGKDIGTVQLRATLAPAYKHLRLEIVTIGLISIGAALFAFVLSYRMHKFVSEPILNLANTANDVSRLKDYSIRAVKETEDELGVLVEAFNEMLVQIQKRENDLEERTAELLQASRMKDEFLATLSHELRTPLNSILGWAVLVREGKLPPDREVSALEAIERNARMQARLIEDLLDVSRIISGKLTVDSSVVGLNQIVESAIEVVRPAALAKQIRVEFKKPPEPVRITGDAARLQQVVWNLLSNAVKFTGDRGSVAVALEKSEHHASISVSDDGIGIAPEFLPYVFDRFRQADGSSTRKHGGLGLGLAIVRHIVEMHGGSVSVDSRGKSQGTTFTIKLPLLVAEESMSGDFKMQRHGVSGESFRLGRAP